MFILGIQPAKTRLVCDPWVLCLPVLLVLSLALWPQIAVSAAPEGWRAVVFDGETDYRRQGDCWLATAQGTASGLVREQGVDLTERPYLHWQWRAPRLADWPDTAEQSRAGDDFQARVYVIKEGWLPWQTRAINYVWSREHTPGTHWPNPYADQAMMVVVQGPGGAGEWHHFSRNVQEDFQRYHGMTVDEVDAVAIMTDGDNTGSRVETCYRLPVFHRQPAP